MKTKILLVDDNEKVRTAIATQLRSIGFDVSEAINGLDGLILAKQQSFDGFVIDQMMPIMDGGTLIKDLRGLPQYQSHPVVLMTTTSKELVAKTLNVFQIEKPAKIETIKQYLLAKELTEQVA